MTNITIQDTGSTSATGQGGQSLITGTPTAGSFANAVVLGSGAVKFEVTGTWTGTLAVEQSADGGVSWVAADALLEGVDTVLQSFTGNAVVQINAAADNQVRLRATAAVTGTAVVSAQGSLPVDLQHVQLSGATAGLFPANTSASASLVTLAASAAGTFVSPDQTNVNGRGVEVILDTTIATTTSAVLTIQGKDPVSGKYYTLLAGAAVTTVTTNVYTVYPGAPVTTNVSANAPLPKTWRVSVVVTGGSSALTATVGANVIV